MSPSPEPRRGIAPSNHDAGFSLIEVIVALGLMTTIMIAVLPQLIVGIKAAGRASDITQAKGVAQGQLEQMRSLPYHVAPSAGDYIDVLDRYFPGVDAPGVNPVSTCKSTDGRFVKPTTTWSGYVAATSNRRCSYEPSTGAFFRTVRVAGAVTGGAEIMVVTDTQFLSNSTPPQPVTPSIKYDSGDDAFDAPTTSQLGITNTVLYADHGTLHPVSTYTQIAETLRSPLRLQGKVNVTAVDVGSLTPAPEGASLTLTAGLLNINGSLSRASTVSTNLTATDAGLSTGARVSGASMSVIAPPTTTANPTDKVAAGLDASCSYVCWGPTSLGSASVKADGGLPNAGSILAPLRANVDGPTNGGFSFGNAADNALYLPNLKLTSPLLSVADSAPATTSPGCSVAGGGVVNGGGFMTTTDPTVDTCGAAAASAISMFPTTFAPQGVVRVRLHRATARCTVAGAAHAASTSYDFSAVVEYYNGTTYVPTPITKNQVTDPLQQLLVDNPSVNSGGPEKLGDYVDSWSSLTTGAIAQKQGGGIAEMTLPGVVKIVSQPVRKLADALEADPTSVVSLTLGAVGCYAEDAR